MFKFDTLGFVVEINKDSESELTPGGREEPHIDS
jgi:hypothetical protein